MRQIRTIASFLRGPSIENKYDAPSIGDDLQHAREMVRSYDPVATLPGRLLPNNQMQVAYFAVRSFWVETGLQFDSKADASRKGTGKITPQERLDWWQDGIATLYDGDSATQSSPGAAAAESNDEIKTTRTANRKTAAQSLPKDHATIRLLSHLIHDRNIDFTRCHFEDIIKSRRTDLDLSQYPDMKALEEHAMWSCGSLFQLVLESGGIKTDERNNVQHQIAKRLGVCHGLTNALRTSIPVLSTTGKLVLPRDLCVKHGVSSPRYLLSALGMGDEECKRAMKNVVADIVSVARSNLDEARSLQKQSPSALKDGTKSMNSVFLPALASETFLDRLEEHEFDLTDRNLRNVSTMEHWTCGLKMMLAAYKDTF